MIITFKVPYFCNFVYGRYVHFSEDKTTIMTSVTTATAKSREDRPNKYIKYRVGYVPIESPKQTHVWPSNDFIFTSHLGWTSKNPRTFETCRRKRKLINNRIQNAIRRHSAVKLILRFLLYFFSLYIYIYIVYNIVWE
jgi:hypothetical protein